MARRHRRPQNKAHGARTVKVKGHTRSPRGPNAGKRAVRVKGYRRKPPV